MAIKGLMSNLSLVKEDRSGLSIGAVTLAAAPSRYVVVRGTGWDTGNGIKGEEAVQAFITGCQLWTMSTFPEQGLAASTTDSIIHFTRHCVFLSAWNSASSEAFSTLWFSMMLKKCAELITHRWWITISTVLSCIYMHFKVLNCSLTLCFILFVSPICWGF